jgi:hypothetical protein
LIEDALAAVTAARRAVDRAEIALDAAMVIARDRGVDWETIARAARTTRNTADHRWSASQPTRTDVVAAEDRDAINAFYGRVSRARRAYTRNYFDCQTCGAKAPDACRSESGKRKDESHAVRVAAAQASEGWPDPDL